MAAMLDSRPSTAAASWTLTAPRRTAGFDDTWTNPDCVTPYVAKWSVVAVIWRENHFRAVEW